MSYANLEHALERLRAGQVVAFPTETVYGLGADARDEQAVRAVFQCKGRPLTHPLIVHIASERAVDSWATEFNAAAQQLAKAFWPGPLTLVLPKRADVLDLVTAEHTTVALRVPAHPVAIELLTAFDGGLVGPSANRFGALSPTTAAMVAESLRLESNQILDGGPCTIGIESTLVWPQSEHVLLLREGHISAAAIEQVTGLPVVRSQHKMNMPGSHLSHYAPEKPLYLCHETELDTRLEELIAQGHRPGLLSPKPHPLAVAYQKAPSSPEAYAQTLYWSLHQLDKSPATCLLVVHLEACAPWQALADRLRRAAHTSL